MNFNNSEEIINNDLEYICRNLQIEFSSLAGKNLLILMTSWKEFQQVRELLKKVNPHAVLVDGHRMLDKRLVTHYEGLVCNTMLFTDTKLNGTYILDLESAQNDPRPQNSLLPPNTRALDGSKSSSSSYLLSAT